MPDALPDYAGENADLDTSRFAGEHEGTSLWLILPRESPGVCLLAYPDETGWTLGCGGENGLTLDGPAGHFVVVPDGKPGPKGTVQVSENVYAYE